MVKITAFPTRAKA